MYNFHNSSTHPASFRGMTFSCRMSCRSWRAAVVALHAFTLCGFAQSLPVNVTVNPLADQGPVGPVYQSSAFAGWSSDASRNMLVSESQTIGLVRMHVERAMSDSQSLSDYKARIATMGADWGLIKNKKGKLVISLARMPRWLANNTSTSFVDPAGFRVYEASPPRDYLQWADLVEATVRRFSLELNLDPYYELWNEPDLRSFWLGTTDEYLKMYRYFVLGARRADPAAKVGGPVGSGFNVQIRGSANGLLIEDFLKYCAATPLPELGYSRLPVNYIVWHQYGSNPALQWSRQAAAVRDLLAESGYPTSTPLVIDEWNLWSSPEWEEPARDTEFNAAFVAAAIASMDRAGITYQAIAALEDYSKDPNRPFHGDFGLLTNETRIRKPAYNAAIGLDRLSGGRKIGATITSASLLPGIRTAEVVASRRPNGEIVIAAWNFIPTAGGIAALSLESQGYDMDQVSAIMKQSGTTLDESVARAMADPNYIETLPYSDAVKADLEEAVAASTQGETLRVTPLAMAVQLQNLGTTRYRLQRYAIDKTNSNAYTAYTNAIAAGQTITQAITAARAKERLTKVEDYTLPVSGVLLPFDMPPYSVQVLVLTPQTELATTTVRKKSARKR
jgi:beta-xylosidase